MDLWCSVRKCLAVKKCDLYVYEPGTDEGEK